MAKSNDVIASEVLEKGELWGALRRALPVQQIRRIMRDKNILNKDLAERLGVSEASVSRMLKGKQNLQLDTLYQLADAIEEKLELKFTCPIEPAAKKIDDAVKTSVDSFKSDFENVFDINKYRPNRNSMRSVPSIAAPFKECAYY
ncbi:helix-turn-helix domain-containing protein [Massilia sp.]|uniref:helix-turn-helix domain-containing protein n=1 Tax=Massilia sp. TaxID=1882437 RepID=UPI00391AC80A